MTSGFNRSVMKDIVNFIARFWFLVVIGALFLALLWMAAFA